MARGLGDRSAALLDAFVAAWARGEAPDPRASLEQAPPAEREQLAVAIDRALAASPAREPSASSRSYVAALRERLEPEEPPLLAARVAQGRKRADVVRVLVERLGLRGREDKVALRYHELETGQLDATGVDESVWSALSAILGEGAISVARTWRHPPAAAPAYYRADAQQALARFRATRVPEPQADEVDRLFGVG
jgi:hypothetical protein